MQRENIEDTFGLADSETYCMRCGNKYDYRDVEMPENASIYWEPHCPSCNAKITALPTDRQWLEILTEPITDHDLPIETIHAHARLYHGRLAGVTVEELVDRARWFDDKQQHRSWSSDRYHRIAFALRRQAREKLQDGRDD